MRKSFFYVSAYMTKWLLVAALVGIGGGLAAWLLRATIDVFAMLGNRLPLFAAPFIGGFLVGLIYLWDKKARGFGTNRYIYSVNRKYGYLAPRTFITKLLATGITLGFKGSGGVEGPMLVIGGSLANALGHLTIFNRYFKKDDYRILTICGAAGAIGAIFRSPLGGGIFVVEVLYRSSLHYSDLFPAILSSAMGFVVFAMIETSAPLFQIPDYLPNVFNVPYFMVAALLSSLISIVFMKVFGWLRNRFKQIPSRQLRPALGGLLTGLVLVTVPAVAGTGTDVIQQLITSPQPLSVLAMLLVAKILATSFTVGSGGSAGLVIPALFIGAIAGNGVATLASADPQFTASLVVSGMAASLAAMANVPIAAAVMLVEMVGMRLGVPATLGSVIGYALGRSQVIYGTTHQYEEEFEEGKEFRKKDRQLEDH